MQTIAHSYFCCSNNLRLWQNTTFGGCWRLVCAGVESDLPGSVGEFLPYSEVSASHGDRTAIFVLGVTFVMTPGEAHIVRRAHLCALRDPGELVGFGVPLGLGGDSSVAKHGWLAVTQRNSVVGEPGAEGFSTAGGHGLCETAFELQEEQGTGGEGRLGDGAGAGIGERVVRWRSLHWST